MNSRILRFKDVGRKHLPLFIKALQAKLTQTLFDCATAAEVYPKGYERATVLVTEAFDEIMTGESRTEDLMVSKVLRNSVDKYRAVLPQPWPTSVPTSMGKSVSEGTTSSFSSPTRTT